MKKNTVNLNSKWYLNDENLSVNSKKAKKIILNDFKIQINIKKRDENYAVKCN